MPDLQLSWRPVTEDDFGLLADWLSRPHVHRYWHHDFSPEGVERDFGPGTRGEEAGEDLLVHQDGVPVALVQRSRIHDYAEDFTDLSAIVEVPRDAVTIDYLIADIERTGKGLGTAIIRAVVAETWSVHPDAPVIIVAVVAGNVGSWRALEKAGFRRIAEGDIEPDNPIDPPRHVVMRIDRPEDALDIRPSSADAGFMAAFTVDGAFSGFSVDDIDAAKEFYGTTLGLEVEANPMGFLDISLPSGGTVLVYSKPNHEPASFTILNFPVADVDAAVDDLIARGVNTKIYSDAEFPSDERGIVRGGGQGPDIAWFKDPAGNVLAVMQA